MEGGGVVGWWGECHVGTQDELMFRLFRVSVSIFPGLTDRPINLIYRVSPHPLTSSTGLLSNNELQRSGTVGALVPIVLARRAIIKAMQKKHSRCCQSGLSPVIGQLHVELLGLLFVQDLCAHVSSDLGPQGPP